MAVQYVMTDAAHKYGLDNMPVDALNTIANQNMVGTVSTEIHSWQGEYFPAGKPATATFKFSNGFTQVLNFNAVGPWSGYITGTTLARTDTGELLSNMVTNYYMDWTRPETNEDLYSGNDSITGNAYNNKLNGFGGNDTIDGKGGTDTAYYNSLRNYYQINKNLTNITVNGLDGIDTIYNVERLKFVDKSIAFDGTAASAYRLYQAAFDRNPDVSGLGYWIAQCDKGLSLYDAAWNFINSAEFKALYGATVSDSGFITALYDNVLHRAPDQGGFDYWGQMLSSGAISRHAMLAEFSESPENVAQVVGSIQNGIEYIPFLA
jgi:hypothetical protein